jgi:predicted CXXCH cytochrome family protein
VRDPQSPVYATNVATTCARCHADAARMGEYKIPTNQMALYSSSVHGEALNRNRDISAPTCNDCHGNHGAAPPGVDAVANACGQCHASQSDLFTKSPHRKAFSENGLPACVTCHEHHAVRRATDALIGVEQTALCVTCHDAGSTGYRAAAEMKAGILSLQSRLEAARHLLERAEQAGMEVSKPQFDLTEGRDRLVRARVEVHRFDPAALRTVLNEGAAITGAATQSGLKALAELAFRRKGLAVSVAILLAMIGLVLAKIRQLEADPEAQARAKQRS